MSSFSITGRIYNGFAAETKGDNFTVRLFTLEVTENGNGNPYTNFIGFQLANDKCALLDSFVIGQMVTVHFNLRGNLWNGKTITNLQAWKMEAAQGQQPAQPQYQQQPQQLQPQPQQWQQPQQPQQPAQFQPQQPAYAPAAPAQPQQQQWAQQPQQQPAFGNAQPTPQPAFGNPQQQPQFYPQQSQSGDLPF